MKHLPHKSEEIFIKKINNFKKIKDIKNNSNIQPLYLTHHKTNSTNTYISLPSTIINCNYTNKKNYRTIETNKSTNIKKEKIMNKTLNISKHKKKIKEKDIQIFFFLKSTHHTEIKPRNKYKDLNIKDIKKRFTDSKIESFITLENRIKKKIDKSILKHHLSEIENSRNKNYNSDRENKKETIEDILNKKQFKYNKDNYQLQKIQPHFSKRSQIGSFSPFSCTPNIMKDNSLMVRLFKQNLNYQKSNIRDKFNDKNSLVDYF